MLETGVKLKVASVTWLACLPVSPHCRGVAAVRLTSLSTGRSWWGLWSKSILLQLRPVYRQFSISRSILVNSAWVCQKPSGGSSPPVEFAKGFSQKEERKSIMTQTIFHPGPGRVPKLLPVHQTCRLLITPPPAAVPLLPGNAHTRHRHTGFSGDSRKEDMRREEQRNRTRLEGKGRRKRERRKRKHTGERPSKGSTIPLFYRQVFDFHCGLKWNGPHLRHHRRFKCLNTWSPADGALRDGGGTSRRWSLTEGWPSLLVVTLPLH